MITQVGRFQRADTRGAEERAAAFVQSLVTFFDSPFELETTGRVIMGTQSADGAAPPAARPVATARLCVICDGRIDDPATAMSPAGFMASAFERYGISCCDRVEGDYAMACYETDALALHLARDPCGARPLYYYLTSEEVIWSSDLLYLATFLGPMLEIDDGYIADYLTGCQCLHRTPYEAIHSVEPGTVLTVTRDKVKTHKFWDIQWHGEITYKRDADYEAHFRCLFTQSVERRLRGASIALADLSGGLDSPSVVCMADDLIKSGRSNCRELETVSYHSEGSPMADESRLIAYVEARRGKKSHLIPQSFFSFDDTLNLSRPDVLLATADAAQGIRRLHHSLGADIQLCGIGGDEVQHAKHAMGQSIAELLRLFQPLSCYRSAAAWAAAERTTIAHVIGEGLRVSRLSRKRQLPIFDDAESMLATLDKVLSKSSGAATG